MLDYFLSRFNSFSLETNGLTTGNLLDRSKKDFIYAPKSDTLLVSLPGWGQGLTEYEEVRKWAHKSGFSLLLYQFPSEILSDDRVLTERPFNFLSDLIRKDIKEYKDKFNFKKCILLGVSLGTSLGSMVYKENEDITSIISVCPGNNLAQDMWHGCRTQHFRKSYEKQGITLTQLEDDWKTLASENNMPHITTDITLLYGTHDMVIPYRDSKELAVTLISKNIKVTVRKFPLGHYALITYFLLFPGKFLKEILEKY